MPLNIFKLPLASPDINYIALRFHNFSKGELQKAKPQIIVQSGKGWGYLPTDNRIPKKNRIPCVSIRESACGTFNLCLPDSP